MLTLYSSTYITRIQFVMLAASKSACALCIGYKCKTIPIPHGTFLLPVTTHALAAAKQKKKADATAALSMLSSSVLSAPINKSERRKLLFPLKGETDRIENLALG
jgi:hypothetical protein